MKDSSLPHPHPDPWPLTRSAELLARARERVGGLTLSMMKRPEQFAPGSFPAYLASGRGALVRDVDGNEYIDFVTGLGANALGHQHPAVNEAIRETLERGLLHSLPVDLEVELAEALVDVIPHAEMARFFKTGADATSAAVRLSRALTKRECIITIGYNGWHDHFMFDTPGVPLALTKLTKRLPLFSQEDEASVLETVRSEGEGLACVLLSVPYNRTLGRPFLEDLRAVCDEVGALLVFDEIVTGFRLGLAGIVERLEVQPDLSTYSKALGAGMPISALVGPRTHMEHLDRLQVSTTFGGELLSLAVARAALRVFAETDALAHIAARGRQLRDGLNERARAIGVPLQVVGYDEIPFLLMHADRPTHEARMKAFQGKMAARGVLLRRDVNFPCVAHTEAQIDFTLDAAERALAELQREGVFA